MGYYCKIPSRRLSIDFIDKVRENPRALALGVSQRGIGMSYLNFKFKKHEKYNDFVKGKRVVIVGAAPGLTELEQGEEIESYDLVARVNKAIPVPESIYKYIGKRTDLFYNCLNLSEDTGGGKLSVGILEEGGLQWMCCPYPPVYPFNKDIVAYRKSDLFETFGFHYIDTEFYRQIENETKTRINSGFGGIMDLLAYDIEELYITGFTFYLGGFYSEYRRFDEETIMRRMDDREPCKTPRPTHEQKPQIRLLQRIWKEDKRIKVDEPLREILSGEIDVERRIKW